MNTYVLFYEQPPAYYSENRRWASFATKEEADEKARHLLQNGWRVSLYHKDGDYKMKQTFKYVPATKN